MDKRVLKAASICHEEKIAEIVLIGKEEEILSLAQEDNIDLSNRNLYFSDKILELLKKHRNYYRSTQVAPTINFANLGQ